ncbi:TetR/AcrR family transcriptional regulator [Arthrobacter sp. Br18]|uniref:TetR/AcrR family transcriptional regulator n=1 Tax=Arthrobacter sp. Br18 TaxID=1312954 RepID=UPI0004B22CBE|nr:TetR/AcrR family transcriptional regulator [Arthrobacter sp. Br18]
MESVKRRRTYDASGRRARAERTRGAVLDAALRSFLATGYAATTVSDIAQQAGVSVETVYKTFGSKAGLVHAIYEQGLAGPGPVSAPVRSDEMRLHVKDPQELMYHWGTLTAEVAGTLTPVLMLIRAAAGSDPAMSALLAETSTRRLVRMEHNARFLLERGFLRPDTTFGTAVDVMWTCSSPELYDLLVLQRGWSGQQFARFVAETLRAALLVQ